jgi:peptidoglycan/LPS O-acetylase OafA/YrhL
MTGVDPAPRAAGDPAETPAPARGRLDDQPRPRRLGYVRPLDGLRGVAVLTVVAYHAAFLSQSWVRNPLPGGFLGVDLFFAISGFLITAGLIDELQSRGHVGYANFWQRRIRRLVPALMALLAAVAVVMVGTGWHLVWLIHARQLTTAESVHALVGTALYVSNWMQAWHMPYPVELSHSWSLAVEMQFYLVWPLVVLGAVRAGWRRSWLVAVLLGGSLVAAIVRLLSWSGPASALPLYMRTDTRADVILLGCGGGLAYTWRWVGGRSRGWLRPESLLGGLVLVVVFVVAKQEAAWLYRGGFVLVAAASTAVITAVTVEPEWGLGRLLSLRPLVWIGERSYSLYLWHLPIFTTLATHSRWRPLPRLVLALVLTVVASEVSYRLVERRLRARPRRLAAPDALEITRTA